MGISIPTYASIAVSPTRVEINANKIKNNYAMYFSCHSVDQLNDNNLKWIGSSNQRIIDVQNTLKNGNIVLHCTQD